MNTPTIDEQHLEFLFDKNDVGLLDKISKDFHSRIRDKLVAQGYLGLKLTFSPVISNITFTGTRLVDIAAMNGMTKQAIRQIANEIESLGYIKRIPDPRDGRAKNLVFSERGVEMVQAAINVVKDIQTENAALLGQEKMQQLHELLSELADKLTAQH